MVEGQNRLQTWLVFEIENLSHSLEGIQALHLRVKLQS
jgi:hypothetical protein